MGIIQFSSTADVVLPLTCEESRFSSALSGLDYKSGGTWTGDALEAARRQFHAAGQSPAVKKVVLLTDGVPCRTSNCWPVPDPTQAQKSREEVSRLRNMGVLITTIRVGDFSEQGNAFIDEISDHVFQPDDFDALGGVVGDVATSVSRECPTPTVYARKASPQAVAALPSTTVAAVTLPNRSGTK